MQKTQYTIQELCDSTGYSRRTVRYYVEIGLVDPPSGRGRGGFYNDSSVNKLMQIKSLQEKGMNLAAIIDYFKGEKTVDQSYLRDVWVKYEIVPGIEISVRRDVEEREGRKVFEIVRVARSIAKEDKRDG